MKYTVANANAFSNLIAEVNELIEKGWSPLGGICVCNEDNNIFYYQAMIKE